MGPSGHGATALLQCLCGLANAAYVVRRSSTCLLQNLRAQCAKLQRNGLNAHTITIDRTRDEHIERHTRYARYPLPLYMMHYARR